MPAGRASPRPAGTFDRRSPSGLFWGFKPGLCRLAHCLLRHPSALPSAQWNTGPEAYRRSLLGPEVTVVRKINDTTGGGYEILDCKGRLVGGLRSTPPRVHPSPGRAGWQGQQAAWWRTPLPRRLRQRGRRCAAICLWPCPAGLQALKGVRQAKELIEDLSIDASNPAIVLTQVRRGAGSWQAGRLGGVGVVCVVCDGAVGGWQSPSGHLLPP